MIRYCKEGVSPLFKSIEMLMGESCIICNGIHRYKLLETIILEEIKRYGLHIIEDIETSNTKLLLLKWKE